MVGAVVYNNRSQRCQTCCYRTRRKEGVCAGERETPAWLKHTPDKAYMEKTIFPWGGDG